MVVLTEPRIGITVRKYGYSYQKNIIDWTKPKGGYPIYDGILVDCTEEQAEEIRKEYRTRQANKGGKVVLTNDNIAKALYVINKEAKRLRDIQENASDQCFGGERYVYNNGLRHYQLHSAKKRKQDLYNIKEEVLKMVDYSIVGYHEFPDKDRLLIEFCGIQFHVNFPIPEGTNNLGEIERIDCKKEVRMSVAKAKKILSSFIKERKQKNEV